MYLVFLILVSLLLLVNISTKDITACDHPIFCYGSVLNRVQLSPIFSDLKDFVDRPLTLPPNQLKIILDDAFTKGGVSALKQAVLNLTLPPGTDIMTWEPPDWIPSPSFIGSLIDDNLRTWAYSLHELWKELGRQVSPSVSSDPALHSLLPQPYPFIVPGGHFRESYYWDSFWIIQGLLLGEMNETSRHMMENMASAILRYGFVPNGGRLYYTNRSQPPLLTQMVELYYNYTKNLTFVETMLPALSKEYDFWMINRSLQFQMSTINHYSSPVTTPRPESYLEDVNIANQLPPEQRRDFYSEVASGAETGWDFSSRWLKSNSSHLSSLITRSILPVDLNAILCQNEVSLYRLHAAAGLFGKAEKFLHAYEERRAWFDDVFWSEERGMWLDRNKDSGQHLNNFYASSLVPLLWGCNPVNYTKHKATLKALQVLGVLDYPGGIPTSLQRSGQQWDFPNVWAPLQWFPVASWAHSKVPSLNKAAKEIATKWIYSTYAGWTHYNHTMFEKYTCLESGMPGEGGEYTVQSGFGWTNGVVLYFLSIYPDISLSVESTHNGTNVTSPSLGWVAAPILIIAAGAVLGVCGIWSYWLYNTGRRRYWGRVQNEHLVAAGGGTSSESQQTRESSDELDNYVEDNDKIGLFHYDV